MINCPQCSRPVLVYGTGRLPPWCPQCGADLPTEARKPKKAPGDKPDAPEPAEDLPLRVGQFPEPKPRKLYRVPLFAGLGVFALIVLMYATGSWESAPTGPSSVARDRFKLQNPSGRWLVDEKRQRAAGADLALRLPFREGDEAYFTVHVVPPDGTPVTPARLATQVKKEWAGQIKSCRFLNPATAEWTVAGHLPERVQAIGWVEGEQRHREAILVVHQGVGYRLTCDAPEQRFGNLRPDFERLATSFTPTGS